MVVGKPDKASDRPDLTVDVQTHFLCQFDRRRFSRTNVTRRVEYRPVYVALCLDTDQQLVDEIDEFSTLFVRNRVILLRRTTICWCAQQFDDPSAVGIYRVRDELDLSEQCRSDLDVVVDRRLCG